MHQPLCPCMGVHCSTCKVFIKAETGSSACCTCLLCICPTMSCSFIRAAWTITCLQKCIANSGDSPCRPQTAGKAEPSPLTPHTRSQPIDMDPRREHNKLRMQLTGAKPSTSPYGTPKGLSRSPLTSPLVGNASQVCNTMHACFCCPGPVLVLQSSRVVHRHTHKFHSSLEMQPQQLSPIAVYCAICMD